jgi:hypothetical protein
MTIPSRLEKRLNNLDSQLSELDDLLSDLEKMRDLSADDPLAQRKKDAYIKNIKDSIAQREADYNAVAAQLNAASGAAANPVANDQLMQISAKLDELKGRLDASTGQIIQQVKTSEANVSARIDQTRAAILAGYEASQQSLLGAILNRLDENQLETLQAITEGIEQIKPGEARQELSEIMTRLDALETEPSVPEAVKEEIAKVKEEVNNQDGAKAGLKLALPLIPGILDLSADSLNPMEARLNLNLGVLKVDATAGQILGELKGIWQRLRNRAKPAEAAG